MKQHRLLKLSENIVLSEQVELLATDLDGVSAILGKQYSVTRLQNHRRLGAVLQKRTGPNRKNLAFELLLLSRVSY